jgi:hypothetical protein
MSPNSISAKGSLDAPVNVKNGAYPGPIIIGIDVGLTFTGTYTGAWRIGWGDIGPISPSPTPHIYTLNSGEFGELSC